MQRGYERLRMLSTALSARGSSPLDVLSLPRKSRALFSAPPLQVIYLVFPEGYSATSGESLARADLSREAIRLGRLLVELLPQPEAQGLLALMLLMNPAAARELRRGASWCYWAIRTARYLAHSAQADSCRRLGRIEKARASYAKAFSLARREPARRFLAKRITELGG